MKKSLLLFLILAAVLSLGGCSQKRNEPQSDFLINTWTGSIGAADENRLDVFDKQRFSYTLFLTSETGMLHKVTAVKPILSDNVSERIISNEPPLLYTENGQDYIRVEGSFVFDTSEMSKEQIIQELDPFINAAKIITEDGSESIVNFFIFNQR